MDILTDALEQIVTFVVPLVCVAILLGFARLFDWLSSERTVEPSADEADAPTEASQVGPVEVTAPAAPAPAKGAKSKARPTTA